MKKKVKRNLYLGKDTCSLVNFVVLLTKQLVCNLPNFISKSSSFLWFSCSQRVEWMEDRWGEKPWGTPECCSSGSGVHGGCLLCMCCPGMRLHGSDCCLFLPVEEAPSLGSWAPCACCVPHCSGALVEGSWHSCGCGPSLCLTETILLPTPDLWWWKMAKKCL